MHGSPSEEHPCTCALTAQPVWPPLGPHKASWSPSPAEVQISSRQSRGVCKGPGTGGPCSLQRAPHFPVAVITRARFTSVILACTYFLIRSYRVRVLFKSSELPLRPHRAGPASEIPGEVMSPPSRVSLHAVVWMLVLRLHLPTLACTPPGLRVTFLQQRQRLEQPGQITAFSLSGEKGKARRGCCLRSQENRRGELCEMIVFTGLL